MNILFFTSRKIIYFYAFIFLLFLASCRQDDINPVQDYKEKLAVFCILDARNECQFVKVQKNMPIWNGDNETKTPDSLSVKIISGNGWQYYFSDTVIKGSENFRTVYYKDFDFQQSSYTLLVQAGASLKAWSSINYYQKTKINLNYTKTSYIVKISAPSYFVRFLVFYKEKINDDWITKSAEVPTIINITNKNDTILYYPGFKMDWEPITFLNTNVLFVENRLLKENPERQIIDGWIFVENLDLNVANYLKAVNGFYDQYSVRLDQPDWSNIINGSGIFGMINADSVKVF